MERRVDYKGRVSMEDKALRTLWIVCGSGVFYYSTNAWLASTGADFHLPGVEFPKFEKAMIYGTLVAPLTYFVLWLSIVYAREHRGEPVALRSVPVLETGLNEGPGLLARWISFLGLTILPVLAQCHFLWQILKRSVFPHGRTPAVVQGPIEMLTVRLPLCKNCWRFGDPEGVEFFPFFQPWFLVFMVCGLFLLLSRLVSLLVLYRQDGSMVKSARKKRVR